MLVQQNKFGLALSILLVCFILAIKYEIEFFNINSFANTKIQLPLNPNLEVVTATEANPAETLLLYKSGKTISTQQDNPAPVYLTEVADATKNHNGSVSKKSKPKTVYLGVDSITAPQNGQDTTAKTDPGSVVIENQKNHPTKATNTKPTSTPKPTLSDQTTTIDQPTSRSTASVKNDSGINDRNEWGWTKLLSATIDGNLSLVEALLNQGADPDLTGKDGRSPLMAASWNRHAAIVNALIKADANVNLKNRDGWTALSFAAWNGDVLIVSSLIQANADKSIKTTDGFSALQLAEQNGHQAVIELLQ